LPVVTTATDISAGATHTARRTAAAASRRREPRALRPVCVRAAAAAVAAASSVQATWKLGIAAYGLNQPDGCATAVSSSDRATWSLAPPVSRGGATGHTVSTTTPIAPLHRTRRRPLANVRRSTTAAYSTETATDGQ
jgi:hypothetical protein